MSAVMQEASVWVDVCALDDIVPNVGICALVEDRQVAVFRLKDGDQLFAIDNRDPNSGANVLSRGIVGNLGDKLVVASPIYKQHFVLASGACIENPEASVQAYPVRVHEGRVQVQLA